MHESAERHGVVNKVIDTAPREERGVRGVDRDRRERLELGDVRFEVGTPRREKKRPRRVGGRDVDARVDGVEDDGAERAPKGRVRGEARARRRPGLTGLPEGGIGIDEKRRERARSDGNVERREGRE